LATELFADVAVRARIFNHPQAIYTYAVPPALRGAVAPGRLVWAPLRGKRVQALVLELREQPRRPVGIAEAQAMSAFTIRPLAELGDPEVQIPPAQIALGRWVAEYYRVSLWDAVALLLPPGVLQESQATWRVLPAGSAVDLGTLPPGEREILYFLRRKGEASDEEFEEALHGSAGELRRLAQALAERGLIVRGTVLTRPAVRVRRRRVARLQLPPADQPAALEGLEHAPRQRELLETLVARRATTPPENELIPAHDLSLPGLRALQARGWVELGDVEALRNPLDGSPVERDLPPELTQRQAAVLQPLVEALDGGEHAVFLLHGVTGSGKTELYLRAIARALRQSRQALVLVPEIALTAQLVRRFAARFGPAVAILHSELSLGERYDTWRRLCRGEARVVVGSRSTVFAPLPDLGLIVVDEEHDGSYKHAEGVRYNARDAAVRLGELTDSVVILGSATPALESYQATRDGNYRLLELPERVAASGRSGSRAIPLPPVRIVDMREELRGGNRSLFSRALQHALRVTLDAGQQAILFLNRRGVASIVLCRDCGYVASCVRCSSPLVLHNIEANINGAHASEPDRYDTIMRCHTCGYRELPPLQCPQCWSARIRHFGVGTQRVVEEMEALFPEARVLRWDRDVTGRKGSHDRLLDTFTRHEADVIVGTQMIAKGLDLPLVTLVGIVSADIGLHLPDLRAAERSFQLLAQVAGRAGRRDLGGQVVLQTYTPDHYALQAAAAHDYHAFFTEEIAFRRDAHYPPFGRLVRFVYAATNAARAQAAAEDLARRLEDEIARQGPADAGVIGPASAFAERVRGRYRWHLLLRAPDVHPIVEALGPLPGWIVDVDPVNML
jgi:primosomal protein N' (replication factor Y)